MNLWKWMLGGRHRGGLLGMLLVLGLVAAPTTPDGRDVDVRAELLPAQTALKPTTTFEVRFSAPIVGEEMVGKPTPVSPLLIDPPLPGKFTWLSNRSGVFTPSEPFLLGHRYFVRLREGLQNVDGNPVLGTGKTYVAPPFEVAGYSFYESRLMSTAQPELPLAFNNGVEVLAAAKHMEFRDNAGQRVPAIVRPMIHREYRRVDAPTVGWTDRFHESHGRTVAEPRPTDVIPTRLYVKPARPLTAGQWRLVVGKGLPSLDPGVVTVKEKIIPLGRVEPLQVTGIHASNVLYQGRSINVNFNRRLSGKFIDGNPLDWIDIHPTRGPARRLGLPNLKAKASGRTVQITGDFPLGGYEVAVKAGLPGAENFLLALERREDVVLNMIQPAVFLPAWMDSQYANGHGKLRLLSLNNFDLRLRVKLLDQNAIAGALEEYRDGYFHSSYYNGHRWVHKEGRPINYNQLSGKTLVDFYTRFDDEAKQAIKRLGGEDVPSELVFDWKKMLGDRKAGVVFVQATSTGTDFRSQCSSQAIIQLTDIGAVWKRGEAEIFIHVFSQTTGQPLDGAEVRLVNEGGKVVGRTRTDETGIARVEEKGGTKWLQVEMGEDAHVLEIDGPGEVSLWQFPIRRSYGSDSEYRLLAFTDRGVYKPGKTVHLKGILRKVDGLDISLPEKLVCGLKVFDPRNEVVLEDKLALSRMGSFAFDLKIPEGRLGEYRLSLLISKSGEEESSDQSPLPFVRPPLTETRIRESVWVHVAEYEPPKYKVQFKSDTEFGPSKSVTVPLEARYYFGKPIAKAPVKWTLVGENAGFHPDKFENYHFLDWSLGREDSNGEFQLEGEGKLDSEGRISIEPKVEINPSWPGPVSGRLMARVTDATQQTITASTRITRNSSDFYLGIRHIDRLLYLGQPAKVDVLALQSDENPHATSVPVKAMLKRIEWRSVRVRGAGGSVDYHNEKTLVDVDEKDFVTSAKDGTGQVVFNPKRSGQYLVELRARDQGDRPVRSSLEFYVPGPQPLAWDYRNEATVELVPDKDMYRPGEVAVLLVKTPISGRALVTVERDKVLRSFQVELKGNAPAIRIPLQTEDAPNVFVSVCLLRGAKDSKRKIATAEYRLGYCELEVEKVDHLEVGLTLARPEYQPGQMVSAVATVRDEQGRPIPGAEVTLYAVDQGVLDLTGYEQPNPEELFIRPVPLGVDTFTSFPLMFTEDPSKVAFGNKGHLIGGGGGGPGVPLRKDFPACAFWAGALKTGADGSVSVRFRAPDGLTSYKVMAVVHTLDSDFGKASASFRVNKPLMVEAALPRFARIGDRIEARAVVFNQTTRDREVLVSLLLDRHAKSADAVTTRTIAIAAGNSQAVMFPLDFVKVGECVAQWRVEFRDGPKVSDALETRLHVRHAAPQRREILLARTDGSEANLIAKADPQLVQGEGTVAVSLSNTRLIELGEAADYLLAYPYGCVEQTSSGLLPWVILGSEQDAIPQLNLPPARARKAVQFGVHRLISMQTHDGGLSYWPGGNRSFLWGSAYGAIALSHAKAHGYPVPQRAIKKLTSYLSRQLRRVKTDYHEYGLNNLCMALYALALLDKAEPAYHEKLFNNRRHLTDADRALLARAIQKSGGQREMVHTLLTGSGRKPIYGWFGCPANSLALQLSAWCRHDPNSPKVDRLLAQLLAGRKNGHWVTTQGNAWSLIALADYAGLVEGEPQALSGTIVWRGQKHPFALDAKNRSVRMLFNNDGKGPEPVLELLNPGNRRIYSSVRVETRTRLRETPRQNRGFSIRRSYSRLDENGKLNELNEWKVGDLVCVSLHLNVDNPGHYVAIDDPLPAVLEAVNPRFRTQQNAGEDRRASGWIVSHSEIRADRMLYFIDHLPPGQHVFRYLARVRAPGKAIAASAKIEEMYHPDRHGISASRELNTQPLAP
ncbi:MAG: hypothetical protein CMO64_08255 [Verrucomicrobiales bacterium]|nr:hypothetical protein [Verrucomicrobiales bacterium]